MAINDVNYNTVVVNAGGTASEDNPATESDNNTLLKIAKLEGVDAEILLKLNPNVKSKGEILNPGTKILTSVGSMTDSIDKFKTATLQVGPKTEKGFPLHIIKSDDTKNTVYCAANTDYPSKPNLSLETIANNSIDWFGTKIDVVTLMKLNPWVPQQMHLIELNKTVLVEVCVPGSSTIAKIEACGIRANSTRTCYIRWYWNHEANNTSGMEVKWEWQSVDGEWWLGTKTDISDIELFENTYSPDESAIKVRVTIRPKEKSLSSTSLTTTKFKWSTYEEINFNYKWSISTPSAPSVEINNYILTASYENLQIYDGNNDRIITHVQFQVIRDDDSTSYNEHEIKYPVGVSILYGYVQYNCKIEAGYTYRVRGRCCHETSDGTTYYSGWSDLSNPIKSLPVAPVLYDCAIKSYNVVEFRWNKISSAEAYELQYLVVDENTYKNYKSPSEYFNNNANEAVSISIDSNTVATDGDKIIYNHTIEDERYLVRVRSVNESAESDWSNIKEITIGELSDSPTTWSSSTTVVIGEPLTLYWIHNSRDNSKETSAEIELTVNGVVKTPYIKVSRPTAEEEQDDTSYYKIDTNSYQNGCKLEWRVRTAGILKNSDGTPSYGDWSMKRIIELYAPPVLRVSLLKYNNEPLSNTLTTLPLRVQLSVGNTSNQKPTGYHISVISQDSYNTVDEVGNDKTVMAGSSVLSKHYDVTDTSFIAELSANDLTLENNKHYMVNCTVSMSSGLISETSSKSFVVGWMTQGYEPNAEIGIDKKTLTARIRPFATGAGDSVNLFVYRREFDGTFTELITDYDNNESGLENTEATWITDPHPALDYARYRIVSRSKDSGVINYFDVPALPIQEKSVVIQWDEKWQNIDSSDGYMVMTNTDLSYNGSILKLPYNIDVSNVHSPDVSLIRYIGRKRPVSYYGTQRGESATWNVEIPKSDTETLYALRRLSIYMGDVYVREPSGSGYWASINVSFSQKHLGLTIPVTINITPVEGGI